MTTVAERRSQLEARRVELVRRMEEVERELDSHQSKDWEEMATEREDDEVLERMGLSARDEIARIDAALDRIAADDYGWCARCGAEISPERLDVVPHTPFCRNCAV